MRHNTRLVTYGTSTLMPVDDYGNREVTEHFKHKIKFKRIKVD